MEIRYGNDVAPYLSRVQTDKVAYRPVAPWPVSAAGTGSSLQRATLLAYGNDPANWFVAAPTPGSILSPASQDVDGDGDEETIYSEGFFDVRWDATSIPDVTLEATQIALAGVACDGSEVPCAEPQIVLAGKMPLHNLPGPADPYIDQVSGYARRVNRPHPSGNLVDPPPNPLASSPFAGTFPIYGCNQHAGAVYYRLLYSFKAPGASSYTSPVPFIGHSWPLYRWVGHLESMTVTPDGSGWYSILNPADGWMPANLLLNWPTSAYQNGTYKIYMELGNAGKSVVYTTTPEIALRVDNSSPTDSQFTGLAWRVLGSSAWIDLDLICPVVARPTGSDIEFRVSYVASAAHLRSFVLGGGGCGRGVFAVSRAHFGVLPGDVHRLCLCPYRKGPNGPEREGVHTDLVLIGVQPDEIGLSAQSIFHLRAIKLGSQMRFQVEPIMARLDAVNIPVQSNHRRTIA